MATTLPRAPKTLGRLRHVFASAVESVQGRPNPLGLEPSKLTVVLLVDGLGSANLDFAAGHVRNLKRFDSLDMRLATVFPTTTASALVSLASGLIPSEHGFVGYNIYDRVLAQSQNMLSGWKAPGESLAWLTTPTAQFSANKGGVSTVFLGHSSYRDSGFTEVIMGGARFIAADTIGARFDEAIRLCKAGYRGVVYLYVPELDQSGHAFGPRSQQWIEQAESLDQAAAMLAGALGPGQQMLVTADHGMVQAEVDEHVHWDAFELETPTFVGGDTRCNFVYLPAGVDLEGYQGELRECLPESVHVVTAQELASNGWLEVNQAVASRLPDFYLICSGRGALYHRKFASFKSLRMLGHHGGISADELNVPGLITRG